MTKISDEEIKQHEQLYRAIEQILIDEGFDAILYGTGGVEDGEAFTPAVVIMIGCDKYSIIIQGHDVVVIRQSERGWCSERVFGTPLSHPNSFDALVTFLKGLSN